MAAEICSICQKPFNLFYIEDKTRPMKRSDIICPYGRHIHRSETTTRTYVSTPAEGSSGIGHRQPVANNGKSDMA
ncbi:hypothetical protein [Neorhizobium petrolearium]|uniref:hypothetical protein n=1 Tax=Neorhizobium petrolearium TaxID=515361 RepID=UPI003F168C3A